VKTNSPKLWKLPVFPKTVHKYDRGQVLIFGGEKMTGAARLSALAARRIGAGLVSIASTEKSWTIYAKAEPGNIIRTYKTISDLNKLLKKTKFQSILIGPGFGVGSKTKTIVQWVLQQNGPVILDADALTSFAKDSKKLFTLIKKRKDAVILTPHAGEFNQLFPQYKNLSREQQALQSSKLSGAIVLLKGSETLITDFQGIMVINKHSSPHLSTAGAGDVLAGMIAGLIAQGMKPFEATCAATWLHGDLGKRLGKGLIAEDLAEFLKPNN
jgi:NAD(P)H-hydrate epimerase